MRIGIMQPTYLPWSGYFNLIDKVDVFVFLDDVQFQRGSWHARNQIVVNGAKKYITVPTRRTGLNEKIKDVVINDLNNWRNSHLSVIRQSYRHAPYIDDVMEVIEPCISDARYELLSDLNVNLIQNISKMLGLYADFKLASDLSCGGKRTEHLIEIFAAVGATQYLSPEGAREYLVDDGFSEKTDVELIFQEFSAPAYQQVGGDGFISHLSIVDVIASIGVDAAREYVKSNH